MTTSRVLRSSAPTASRTSLRRSARVAPVVAAVAAAVVVLASCGSTAGTTESAESSGEAAPTTIEATVPETTEAEADTSEDGGIAERPEAVSDQDVALARASLVGAQTDWEASGITSYTLEVGVETIGSVTVEVVDGLAVSETINGEEVDAWFNEPLPRTVEALFAEVDGIISPFEADPSLVPAPGDCGMHFNVKFDAELGYPTYYDELGPCDDGVGLTATVIPDD